MTKFNIGDGAPRSPRCKDFTPVNNQIIDVFPYHDAGRENIFFRNLSQIPNIYLNFLSKFLRDGQTYFFFIPYGWQNIINTNGGIANITVLKDGLPLNDMTNPLFFDPTQSPILQPNILSAQGTQMLLTYDEEYNTFQAI